MGRDTLGDTLGGRAASGLIRRSGAGRAPLSHAQQRLWFLERLEPGTSAYTTLSSMRWTGRLDPAVLERCLGEVVCRHDALRTTFTCEPGGEPVQVVGAARAQRLPVVDLATLPSGRRAAEASRLAAAVARQSFDLERGPLLRAALLRLGAKDAVLLLAIHHIVTDSRSTTVLAREVSALYDAFSRGLPSPLTALPVQYADFALWQRERLQGGVLAAELEYWRRRLAALPVLCLPADRPRPARVHVGEPVPRDEVDGPGRVTGGERSCQATRRLWREGSRLHARWRGAAVDAGAAFRITMSEPLVIVGNGMAAACLCEELAQRALGRYAVAVIGEGPQMCQV